MKLYVVPLTVLILVVIKRSSEETFKITRSVEGPEKFYSSRDKFQINASNCRQLKCSQFDSESTETSCYCKCPMKRPSFVYEGGKWACNVDKAPIDESCGFGNTPIYYLGAEYATTLDVPQPNVPCTVNETASRYQDCEGTWKPVGNNGRFRMKETSGSVVKKTYELLIRATTGTPDIRGRIIKLSLTCKPKQGKPCFFFKITGSVNCSINPFERTTIIPITKEPTPLTTKSPPLETKFTSVKQSMSITAATNTSTENGMNKSEKSNVNLAAIISGTLAAVVVLVVCFTMVFILHRRERGNNSGSSTPRKDPENKMQYESQNTNDIFSQANPIYAEAQDKKGPSAKTRPPIPSIMRPNGKEVGRGTSPKPPVKPRRKKQRVGGGKIMSDFAAMLRNSFASSSENMSQLTNEQTAPTKKRMQRKKPAVPPKPALKPKMGAGEEYDEFDDYDSDEWESFSEPESHDNNGMNSEEKIVCDKGHYDSPHYSIVSKSPEHSLNTASGDDDFSKNNIYDSAEACEGQTVEQPEISKLGQGVSAITTNTHIGGCIESEGNRDDNDCYDKPEHIIIT